MSHAKSTLDALLANDPENPAIRDFITFVEEILSIKKSDQIKIILVDAALRTLQQKMLS